MAPAINTSWNGNPPINIIAKIHPSVAPTICIIVFQRLSISATSTNIIAPARNPYDSTKPPTNPIPKNTVKNPIE